MTVMITDYIKNPSIEREILGKNLSNELIKEVEVLLVWHLKIDESYLKRFPKLKGIVRYGVGYDSIDLDSIRARNLIFCNTPDYGIDEVSSSAIAMILNISRGISRYDHQCRGYDDDSWQENTITNLKRSSEMIIGILGAGRIGGNLCLKAKALGFQVIFFDPYLDRGYEKMLGVSRVESLAELLKLSDIISLNIPLSDSTKGIVNTDFIKMMKPGASLVNTARGELIDNLDIIHKALETGHLECAAFDVLPDEPPSNDNSLIKAWKNREQWLDGRLIINPHSAYYTKESYKEMRYKAAKNALRILRGETPHNIIVENS